MSVPVAITIATLITLIPGVLMIIGYLLDDIYLVFWLFPVVGALALNTAGMIVFGKYLESLYAESSLLEIYWFLGSALSYVCLCLLVYYIITGLGDHFNRQSHTW